MSPVASVTMTVKLKVILKIPPRVAAAPMRAYFPGSTLSPGNIVAIPIPTSRPQAAPIKRLGINKPLGIARPYVHTARI